MIENEMDYCGSKSVFFLTEKEQRVNDSCLRKYSKLRYTLKDYENNYQFRYPSNRFKQLPFKLIYSTLNINKDNINSWFITGFTHAEGSFSISICKDKRAKNGFNIQLIYSVSLHKKKTLVLQRIKMF